MAADLTEVARSELKQNEQLIWSGRCYSRVRAQSKEVGPLGGALIFGIGGLIIGFVMAAVTRGYGTPLVPITVAGGIYFSFRVGPSRTYRKKRTIHVLTNRRVMVIEDLYRDRRVRSFPLDYVGNIDLHRRDATYGSLTLHAQNSIGANDAREQRVAVNTDKSLRLLMIHNPEDVRQRILEAKERLTKSAVAAYE